VTLALIPIFALAYPLLDTGVAILRRWLRGVPLSRADTRHVHHQLGSLGLGARKALFVIYGASGAIAVLGLLIVLAPPDVTLMATMVGVGILVLVIALGIHWLQYHEFLEAGASLAHAIRKSRSVIQDKINARDLATNLRGARSMEEVQSLLADSADTFRFAYMKLSDPFSRKQAAGRITQELQTLKLWKLEYPILQRASDKYDGLCLTIWSAISNGQRPAGAERVARILAPAIAEWVGGRKRTPEELEMADRGIPLAGAHPSTHADRQRGVFVADLRLLELEGSEPGNTLEA
jgi:UDP-GlcNAc:undecaprenyl-phosphate GlcNAc-1-phosphate transferase